MRRRPIKVATSIVALGLLFVAGIYLLQSRLIYFPRPYNTYYQSMWSEVDRIAYESKGAKMVAYGYPKNRTDQVPGKIWWLFGGNGSLALDWLVLLESESLPTDTQIILFDYPGYGQSEGKPHPESIIEAFEVLQSELAAKWQLTDLEIKERSSAMGHSLGAAVALEVAAKHQFDKVVAVSPFTSMSDMAQRQVGWLKFLLNHHYDNRASVRLLFSENDAAELILFHGERDSLIPISMSQELQALAQSNSVTLHSVPVAGHNDIVSKWARTALSEILTQP